MLKRITLISLVLFLSSFLLGNVFYWTDKNGVKHFSNVAPPAENKNTQVIETDKKVPKKRNRLEEKVRSKTQFKVLKIYDGDSIKIKGLELEFQIRLVGIDAPEMGYKNQKGQKFSQEAKTFLESLIYKRVVTIKGYGMDPYKRQLAEVFVDGDTVNLEMVKAGFAEVYKGEQPKTFDAKPYYEEELKAKRQAKGSWVDGYRFESPLEWRQKHPRK